MNTWKFFLGLVTFYYVISSRMGSHERTAAKSDRATILPPMGHNHIWYDMTKGVGRLEMEWNSVKNIRLRAEIAGRRRDSGLVFELVGYLELCIQMTLFLIFLLKTKKLLDHYLLHVDYLVWFAENWTPSGERSGAPSKSLYLSLSWLGCLLRKQGFHSSYPYR